MWLQDEVNKKLQCLPEIDIIDIDPIVLERGYSKSPVHYVRLIYGAEVQGVPNDSSVEHPAVLFDGDRWPGARVGTEGVSRVENLKKTCNFIT